MAWLRSRALGFDPTSFSESLLFTRLNFSATADNSANNDEIDRDECANAANASSFGAVSAQQCEAQFAPDCRRFARP